MNDNFNDEEDNPIAQVIIMAGIPGSGKTTAAKLAKERVENDTEILSTDDFWLDENGEYEFDASRLNEAHECNLLKFVGRLRCASSYKPPVIIVDNTNTTIAEIAPYYALAQAYGADVRVLVIATPWEVAASRQRHGLPKSKVYQMHLRLEETLRSFPSWWNLEVMANG